MSVLASKLIAPDNRAHGIGGTHSEIHQSQAIKTVIDPSMTFPMAAAAENTSRSFYMKSPRSMALFYFGHQYK